MAGVPLTDDMTDAVLVAHSLQLIGHELERIHTWLYALADGGMKQRIVHTLTTEIQADAETAIRTGQRFEYLLGGLLADVLPGRFQADEMYKILRDQVIEPVRSARTRTPHAASNGLAVNS